MPGFRFFLGKTGPTLAGNRSCALAVQTGVSHLHYLESLSVHAGGNRPFLRRQKGNYFAVSAILSP